MSRVEGFAGFEPQVGEIRALRTFRVGPDGGLYPLFSDTAWSAGVNTAHCLLRIRQAPTPGADDEHAAPAPDCRCGFYAYGSLEAAGEYPYARHVRAVVSCWGHVIAGTRGLRAQHSRIEALWLSPAVPDQLVELVRVRYPAVAIYRTGDELLTHHPLTELDCYELDTAGRRRWREQRWLGAVAAGAVVLGALPTRWLGGSRVAALTWGILAGAFLLLGLCLTFRRSLDAATHRRCLLSLVVGLWMLAPFAGAVGFVFIRLPLLELAALLLVRRYRMTRAAGRFPATIG